MVKLSDFGLSKTWQDVEEAVGKAAREIPVRWTAPEVMVNGEWSEKSDVWSFGVLLWEIYSDGDVPFGLVVRCVGSLSRGYCSRVKGCGAGAAVSGVLRGVRGSALASLAAHLPYTGTVPA